MRFGGGHVYEMFRTIAGRSIPRYTPARALLPLLTGMSAHCKLTVIDALAGQGDISQDGRINRLACPTTRTRQRDCQPSQTINCELIFLLADEKKYCVGRNEKCLNRQMKLEAANTTGHGWRRLVSGGARQEKISNELRAALEPLIPAWEHSPKGGRRRSVDDQAASSGILYVLHTVFLERICLKELGCGSGRHVGGGYAIGRQRACGRSCIWPCCAACTNMTKSIGVARAWTVRRAGEPARTRPTGAS